MRAMRTITMSHSNTDKRYNSPLVTASLLQALRLASGTVVRRSQSISSLRMSAGPGGPQANVERAAAQRQTLGGSSSRTAWTGNGT
jgi:hypothetical protein